MIGPDENVKGAPARALPTLVPAQHADGASCLLARPALRRCPPRGASPHRDGGPEDLAAATAPSPSLRADDRFGVAAPLGIPSSPKRDSARVAKRLTERPWTERPIRILLQSATYTAVEPGPLRTAPPTAPSTTQGASMVRHDLQSARSCRGRAAASSRTAPSRSEEQPWPGSFISRPRAAGGRAFAADRSTVAIGGRR